MSTFGGAVVGVGNALIYNGGIVVEVVVEFAFVEKLRVLAVYGLEFDGHFQVGLDVDSLVDFSEGALVDFTQNFVVFANFLGHLRHNNKNESKKKELIGLFGKSALIHNSKPNAIWHSLAGIQDPKF